MYFIYYFYLKRKLIKQFKNLKQDGTYLSIFQELGNIGTGYLQKDIYFEIHEHLRKLMTPSGIRLKKVPLGTYLVRNFRMFDFQK